MIRQLLHRMGIDRKVLLRMHSFKHIRVLF